MISCVQSAVAPKTADTCPQTLELCDKIPTINFPSKKIISLVCLAVAPYIVDTLTHQNISIYAVGTYLLDPFLM